MPSAALRAPRSRPPAAPASSLLRPPAEPARAPRKQPPSREAPAMISTIFGAFRVKEIRNKILFTALMLGSYVPAPGISRAAVSAIQKNFGGTSILGLLNTFSGGGLGRIALFALGIM